MCLQLLMRTDLHASCDHHCRWRGNVLWVVYARQHLGSGIHGAGVEVSLIPLYTPIRVDEENLTSAPFFGGINTYLNDRSTIWRHLPRFLTRWLDSPAMINRATRGAVGNNAAELGSMTASMLSGEFGPHRRAGEELADYVAKLKPDVVCYSNSILSGSLRTLRQRYSGKIFCVLQGDDVFLDGLIEPYRREVMARLTERASEFDGYIATANSIGPTCLSI